MYFGSIFLMFEASTPFLNIIWFCDKTDMTGGVVQMIAGVLLIISFFLVRIVCGLYFSAQYYIAISAVGVDKLIVGYTLANVILNTLNLVWFKKIIMTVLARRKGSNKKSQ